MALFKTATREKLKLRMALDGPSGSGKTYTGLRMAFAIAGQGGRVAVIDTEHRAASKYQGESPDGIPWNFDVCELEYYSPTNYTNALREAGLAGYDVVLIDSLSHAWEGKGGALDQVDNSKVANKFTAWKDVTPQHREMIEAILASPCHVIVTMRTKTAYVLEENEKKQMVPRKVGMEPIQRQGMEYEFDVVADIDLAHLLTVSKTRCSAVDGVKVSRPGPEFVTPILRWLSTGAEPAARPEVAVFGQPVVEPVHAQLVEPAQSGNGQQNILTAPCTNVQRAAILQLAESMGMSPDDIRGVLAKRGVAKLADLTYSQANDVIDKMQAVALAGTAAGNGAGEDIPF